MSVDKIYKPSGMNRSTIGDTRAAAALRGIDPEKLKRFTGTRSDSVGAARVSPIEEETSAGEAETEKTKEEGNIFARIKKHLSNVEHASLTDGQKEEAREIVEDICRAFVESMKKGEARIDESGGDRAIIDAITQYAENLLDVATNDEQIKSAVKANLETLAFREAEGTLQTQPADTGEVEGSVPTSMETETPDDVLPASGAQQEITSSDAGTDPGTGEVHKEKIVKNPDDDDMPSTGDEEVMAHAGDPVRVTPVDKGEEEKNARSLLEQNFFQADHEKGMEKLEIWRAEVKRVAREMKEIFAKEKFAMDSSRRAIALWHAKDAAFALLDDVLTGVDPKVKKEMVYMLFDELAQEKKQKWEDGKRKWYDGKKPLHARDRAGRKGVGLHGRKTKI